MNDYIVVTRIVVSATSEKDALTLVDAILTYGKLFHNGLRYKIINARKCSKFLPAEQFLLKGYNKPRVNMEDKEE